MASLNQGTIKNNIYRTILELISFLKADVIKDATIQSDLNFIENIFSMMNSDVLTKHVVKHVVPHEKKIRKRDVTFFTSSKNRNIFSIVPEEKYAYLSNLIKDGKVNEENMTTIFDYFESLLELGKLVTM